MKGFARKYLKALGLCLVIMLVVGGFVGLILLPVWVRDTFGVGYGLALFGFYILLYVGFVASTMDD